MNQGIERREPADPAAILVLGNLVKKSRRVDSYESLDQQPIFTLDPFEKIFRDGLPIAELSAHMREIDASIPLRVLEINEAGMAAARRITPYGYLTAVQPGPIFIGVEKPMKVYSFDNVLLTKGALAQFEEMLG